jgi:hypothetical protein
MGTPKESMYERLAKTAAQGQPAQPEMPVTADEIEKVAGAYIDLGYEIAAKEAEDYAQAIQKQAESIRQPSLYERIATTM